MEGLFSDIGGKIKGLAVGVFVVECISAVIAFIALMVEELYGTAVITLLGGPLVAYVSVMLIYGFGELVDCASFLAESERYRMQTKKDSEVKKEQPAPVVRSTPSYSSSPSRSTSSSGKKSGWTCTCGRTHQDYETSCVCGMTKAQAKLAQK